MARFTCSIASGALPILINSSLLPARSEASLGLETKKKAFGDQAALRVGEDTGCYSAASQQLYRQPTHSGSFVV